RPRIDDYAEPPRAAATAGRLRRFKAAATAVAGRWNSFLRVAGGRFLLRAAPVLHRGLRCARQCEAIGGRVFSDGGTRADGGTGTDGHWRNKRAVGADERAIFHLRDGLVHA